MAGVHIIGIGSPFGDDRSGWVAVEALRCSPVLKMLGPKSIEISVCDQPGAVLVHALLHAEQVILIDAIRSGAPPGSLHRLERDQIMDKTAQPLSSHGFSVATAVQLAETLNGLPARLVLFGIEINPMHSGDELSEAVRAKLPDLQDQIETEIAHWLGITEPMDIV